MARIVVIGAGVGGLGAALGLADRGHDVLVVERDPPPPTTRGDDAFEEWDRPHVPQFRQAHAFSARSRNLLVKYAPAVLDRLRADGIEEINFFKLLAPPELHRPEDDEFTGLLSRRPAFELALRMTVGEHPGIEIRCPAIVTGLLHGDDPDGVRIAGVQLDNGVDERADLVIDAGGRRSPTSRWLNDLGVEVGEDVQDCGITYHTRYYRQTSTSTLSTIMLPGVRGELEGVLVLGFVGDHGTYGLMIAAPPWDDELKVLRYDWAFDAALAEIPSAAPWAAPENGIPLHSVATMAGHQNVLRHWVVDGEPVVLGLLPVGDALCTTNPAYGWGASMALTYAFAAVDAIGDGGDPRTIALRYHDAVCNEADGVYRESAAMDRTRRYRWQLEAVPEHDAAEAERQSLIAEGIIARRTPRSRARPGLPAADEPVGRATRDPRRPRGRPARTRHARVLRVPPAAQDRARSRRAPRRHRTRQARGGRLGYRRVRTGR